MSPETNNGTVTKASAKALDLPVSTKHCIEISKYLRYKTTSQAKSFLEKVIALEAPVPLKTFHKDRGHRKGMAAGAYPQKAAKEILKLIKSVESNAQNKGLNPAGLQITTMFANIASIPMTGGRHSSGTKRSHVEIEVTEVVKSKKETVKKSAKSAVDSEAVKEKSVEEKVAEKKVTEEKATKVKSTPVTEPVRENVAVKEATALKETVKETVKGTVKEAVALKDVKEAVKVAVKETLVNKEVKILKEVKELSSEELLKKAQAKAAELNLKQERKEDIQKVEKLYEELTKKGSLRKA